MFGSIDNPEQISKENLPILVPKKAIFFYIEQCDVNVTNATNLRSKAFFNKTLQKPSHSIVDSVLPIKRFILNFDMWASHKLYSINIPWKLTSKSTKNINFRTAKIVYTTKTKSLFRRLLPTKNNNNIEGLGFRS